MTSEAAGPAKPDPSAGTTALKIVLQHNCSLRKHGIELWHGFKLILGRTEYGVIGVPFIRIAGRGMAAEHHSPL
jgi:hypothetical protein